MHPINLYRDIPASLPEELIQIIAKNSHIRIERIISKAHASEPGFWYDQSEDEWVLLLQGSASLQFEGDQQHTELIAGDYLLIPAGSKHRIIRTDSDRETIWLAIFSTEPLSGSGLS